MCGHWSVAPLPREGWRIWMRHWLLLQRVAPQSMRHLATRIGAQVVAEGVERSEQLATLRQYGVGIAQGNLLGAPGRRPVTYLPIAGIAEFRTPVSTTPTRGLPEARISDFMHPALTLPISTTGEAVRAVLSDRPSNQRGGAGR